jgi:hypothetical protein
MINGWGFGFDSRLNFNIVEFKNCMKGKYSLSRNHLSLIINHLTLVTRHLSFIIYHLTLIVAFYGCTPEEEPLGPVFLSEVFEYVYAPGQHAQLALPTDTQFVTGDPATKEGFLYLGGFGGYVVAGFPRDVVDGEGADFEVFALVGAAPEPAVVYVMMDANKNGRPDDTWYELKGNLFEESKRNYSVTYTKSQSTEGNIQWTDSDGASGELRSSYGALNSAAWWWPYTSTNTITFNGTRLPDAYVNQSSNGADNWVVPEGKFQWGYAENNKGTDYDSNSGSNQLDISNAVDAEGQAVKLVSIRFIKIQTAVFQQNGQINEVSAEIRGARSLR